MSKDDNVVSAGNKTDMAIASDTTKRFQTQVEDILEAISATEDFIANMDLSSFCNDQKTIYAVERSVGIIGATAKRLPITFLNKHPEISWRNLIGVGDRLIYGYFEIDITRLWAITQEDMPKLKHLMSQVLAEISQTD